MKGLVRVLEIITSRSRREQKQAAVDSQLISLEINLEQGIGVSIIDNTPMVRKE